MTRFSINVMCLSDAWPEPSYGRDRYEEDSQMPTGWGIVGHFNGGTAVPIDACPDLSGTHWIVVSEERNYDEGVKSWISAKVLAAFVEEPAAVQFVERLQAAFIAYTAWVKTAPRQWYGKKYDEWLKANPKPNLVRAFDGVDIDIEQWTMWGKSLNALHVIPVRYTSIPRRFEVPHWGS